MAELDSPVIRNLTRLIALSDQGRSHLAELTRNIVELKPRRKLIDDASGKYFVGHETSPILNPKYAHCASIWLSKTKSSEFSSKGSLVRTSRLKAR